MASFMASTIMWIVSGSLRQPFQVAATDFLHHHPGAGAVVAHRLKVDAVQDLQGLEQAGSLSPRRHTCRRSDRDSTETGSSTRVVWVARST